MRDFINKIKIRYKIILSFSIIGLGIIILGTYQYQLFLSLGGSEKSNKTILETIGTINYLKGNLSNIQYLQSEIFESMDTSQIITLDQKWQEYNLNFKRNYNLISSSVLTKEVSNFEKDWISIYSSASKIRKQYDSLIVVSMDSSLSLVKQRYALNSKNTQSSGGLEEAISESDLVYLEDSTNIDTAINTLDELQQETETELPEIDFSNFDLESETDNANNVIRIKEINAELSDLKKTVNIGYQSINEVLGKNEKKLYGILAQERNFVVQNAQTIINHSGFIIVLALIAIFILTLWIISKISIPIEEITKGVKELGKGNLNVKIALPSSEDELGNIQKELKNTVKQLSKINRFSQNIASQNFTEDYTPLSEDDNLSQNLIKIRNNFKEQIKTAQERISDDKKYTWINDGIAKFNTLLRLHSRNLEELSDNVFGDLINYVGAMQGGFFVKVINNQEEDNFHLDLVASFAYNRKKYFKRKIVKGEGIVGTVAVEGKKVMLTKLPADYLEIRSGLGGTEPKCLLVVPMIINEDILGVLEIASLHIFKDFEIEFIEKVAESIAASISSIKISAQTSFLLEQSRKQADELGKEQNERQIIIRELQEAQEKALSREQELKDSLEEYEKKNESLKENDLVLKSRINEANELYKSALFSLEKQQKLQMEVFERALDGIIVINGRGEITYTNPVVHKIWNYSADELLGEKVNKLMPTPHNETHDEYINNYLQTGVKKIIGIGRRVEGLTKNNEKKAIRLEVLDTSFGNQIQFTAIVKDLSEYDELTRQLTKLKKNTAIHELKYENYITELSKILNSNGIAIPEMKDFGHKIIENENDLMINSKELDPLRMQILEKINSSFSLMNNDKMNESSAILNSVIKEFKEYFKQEEEILEKNSFGKLREHKKWHKKITIKLLEYKNLIKKDEIELIYNFYEELKQLVVEHFTIEDKNIVDFVY